MPRLHNVPPSAVHADIESLQQPLEGAVPSKRLDEKLLVASWNIRGFASLTRKWTAGGADSPKQDLRGLLAIGEIIRRFDVIAAGDFDIDRKNNPLWQAFTSTGLTVAEDWRAHPDPYLPIRTSRRQNTTIRLPGSRQPQGRAAFRSTIEREDLLTSCHTSTEIPHFPKSAISYRISDHYPL